MSRHLVTNSIFVTIFGYGTYPTPILAFFPFVLVSALRSTFPPVSTLFQPSVLSDKVVNEPGDFYIRSVYFSPNRKFLAAGGDDKLIRVRHLLAVSGSLTLPACLLGLIQIWDI
ncbi:uncharacterized protein EI90DRAFT_3057555, partial [Cantharellus anzutake]|uniref:uncharacterized protein n=1 Tax=Cantharellus anzutake TaxID=1750568 RepID=UPI001905C879